MAAARAFSAPKRVARRPKSWLDITHAARPGMRVHASIALRSACASQGACKSSKAKTASK